MGVSLIVTTNHHYSGEMSEYHDSQPSSGRSSPLSPDFAGNFRKPYRMASTLCLGPDHQPQSQGSPRIYRERKARLDDNSFFNLFGAGDCVGAKAERSRARRALPVNTLTGAIIGSHPAHQLEQPTFTPTLSPPRSRRPPGGAHCPLW